MKKFICAVLSMIGGLYAWWASFLGSNEIFKFYGLYKIGNGVMIIFTLLISIAIGAMVGCFWYFAAFNYWTKEKK